MINYLLLAEAVETLPPQLAYRQYSVKVGPRWKNRRIDCGNQHLHNVLRVHGLCPHRIHLERDGRATDLCVAKHYGLTYKQVARIRILNDRTECHMQRVLVVREALEALLKVPPQDYDPIAAAAAVVDKLGIGFGQEEKTLVLV